MSTEMQTKVQASPAQNFIPVQTDLLQRKSALCNTPGLVEDSERDKEKLTLQRSSVDQAGTTTVPPIVHRALRSPGQPLDPETRAYMEPRFGHDFSQVRVHSGGAAEQSAREVNANAYTVGNDIVFGKGRFASWTHEGRRLIAHELTHVVQQSASLPVSQPDYVGGREADHKAGQASGGSFMQERANINLQTSSGINVQRHESGKPVPITARTVFPYPEKSRLVVSLLLNETEIETIIKYSGSDPNSVLAVRILRAAETKVATVTAASDDLFEAVIPSVKLPKEKTSPVQTVDNVAVRFSRQADGKFRFELKAGPTTLFVKDGLEASKRSDGKIVLSPSEGPNVIVYSKAKTDKLDVMVKYMVFKWEVLRLTKLPDAPIGSAVEKKAIQQIIQKAQETRRERKHEFTLGAWSGAKGPLFSTSWRMSLYSLAKTAGLVQIPLHIYIDYAPDKSVLAGVSAGGELAIPTKIPINVRIVGGVAGGVIEGTATGEGKNPLQPAIGPTIGAGVGIGGKTFRVEVDYKYFWNLAPSSNVRTVILSVGLKI